MLGIENLHIILKENKMSLTTQQLGSKFDTLLDRGVQKDIISFLVNNASYQVSELQKVKLFESYLEVYEMFFEEDLSSPELQQLMFDKIVASKYINKIQNAESRGIEFSLSLTSFKNMLKAKKCFYTKKPITLCTLTIDRIDSSKGYVKGNVCACHKDINQVKSAFEKNNGISYQDLFCIANKLKGRV